VTTTSKPPLAGELNAVSGHRQLTRVLCRASHPSNASTAGSGDGRCNTILGDVPGPVRFVRLSTRAPEELDGKLWLRCGRRDCKMWNVFDLISRP
jgi:hypothetical protein